MISNDDLLEALRIVTTGDDDDKQKKKKIYDRRNNKNKQKTTKWHQSQQPKIKAFGTCSLRDGKLGRKEKCNDKVMTLVSWIAWCVSPNYIRSRSNLQRYCLGVGTIRLWWSSDEGLGMGLKNTAGSFLRKDPTLSAVEKCLETVTQEEGPQNNQLYWHPYLGLPTLSNCKR